MLDRTLNTEAGAPFGRTDAAPVEWAVSRGLVAYPDAVAAMEARAAAIAEGRAGELVWLLEHPPLYTAGTSARPEDLVEARFPVHQVLRLGRGAIIELDATEGDEVRILANNFPVAKGTVVVQGNRIAVEVRELLPRAPDAR